MIEVKENDSEYKPMNAQGPKNKNSLAWDGKGSTDVMVAGEDLLPVVVAHIRIDGVPLIVEPWMIQRVLRNASKELCKYVTSFNSGKLEN